MTAEPRIVLLAGPSGSGKSRLAHRLRAARGWPIVNLDDFYRDDGDPAMPRSDELGIVDWDDPRSWDGDAAVAALTTLTSTGVATVPCYDIATSRAHGCRVVTVGDDELVVAEGIFAAELIAALSDLGLLRTAYVVAHPRAVNFVRRLTRDLRTHRKPPGLLLRRGVALMRDERGIVARQVLLGGVLATPREVERRLLGLGRAGASAQPSPRGTGLRRVHCPQRARREGRGR